MAFAHSKNAQGNRQELSQHLTAVAEQAAEFARSFSAHDLAYYAGLLHDIGKLDPAFQRYLLEAEANPGLHRHGPDHKGAGAVLVKSLGLDLLALVIAGHHGGLESLSWLKEWLRDREAATAVREAIAAARAALPQLQTVDSSILPTAFRTAHDTELFIRLVFSALVDADFLDTERHFAASKGDTRGGGPGLEELWTQLQRDQERLSGQRHDQLNVLRHEVYQNSLQAAALQPGFFRLTAPTGSGKTRVSLAFALRHALTHGHTRVIYAIPYTSITEQTADVFRAIFADPRAVLEHHSAVTFHEDANNPSREEMWTRLAAENWDAPIIVTTTVQLFESLMDRATSACRKLHNVARSVIILDEAQMLPTHLLEPTLDILRQLVSRYGATVVLCTATQPALDARTGFPGLEGIRDILPDAPRLFAALKRVEYELPPPGERWTWEQVALAMHGVDQALAVVNTRADAVALLEALDDPSAFHLSTWMCGAHRRAALSEVRRRLASGLPCRLVSTQVIEAGVDVDFPLVLRAMGPLDRIVQAAGRCNREGRLDAGRVIIFDPAAGGLPPGPYRTGTQVTQNLLADPSCDLHDPAIYQRYFEAYYGQIDPDERRVQETRAALDYPEVATRFRMIEDDTSPIVVRYPTADGEPSVDDLIASLRRQPVARRDQLRRLQPYIVGLRAKELAHAEQRGLVAEIIPGLYEWLGRYDETRGIALEGAADPGSLIWDLVGTSRKEGL
jgi:CRISPR-associated endonuclease/helicase Cas3